jgi:hypothetical protein
MSTVTVGGDGGAGVCISGNLEESPAVRIGSLTGTTQAFRIQESEFRMACEYASSNLLTPTNIVRNSETSP